MRRGGGGIFEKSKYNMSFTLLLTHALRHILINNYFRKLFIRNKN